MRVIWMCSSDYFVTFSQSELNSTFYVEGDTFVFVEKTKQFWLDLIFHVSMHKLGSLRLS